MVLPAETVALAMDFKPDGFMVICMCPGWVAPHIGMHAERATRQNRRQGVVYLSAGRKIKADN